MQREKKNFAEEQARRDAERDAVLKQSTLQFNVRSRLLPVSLIILFVFIIIGCLSNFSDLDIESQEKIETLTRQHQLERRTLEESLQGEREAWIENYRRQQSSKFEMAQARIMDECNRERDRQIELAIARLEKETRDMKANMQKNWENKLRFVKRCILFG